MSFYRLHIAALFVTSLCLSAVACFAGNNGGSLAVEAKQTGFARFFAGMENFGKLQFRGGLILSSNDDRFGGFSGLAFSTEGDALMAVSDDGWWFKADVRYEDGRPVALTNAVLAPLLNRAGRRPASKPRRDAEAMALDPPGQIGASVYVGFEMHTRIEKFDMVAKGLMARPVALSAPILLAKGPENNELEALGKLSTGPFKGSLLAISERNLDSAGNIRAWIINGKKDLAFAIARYQDYDITDLAVLPDGRIITLERSFSPPSSLAGAAMRSFATIGIEAGTVIVPELLFSGRQPFYLIDNMEGIAVHRWGGELRISIISDDNYNRGVQRTVLFQFALPP